MIRTFARTIRFEPTGSNSLSCSTRSSLPCSGTGMSPISSRKSVPPSASSNLPTRPLRSAPVYAPGAAPKNSVSSSASGIAATLTVTSGFNARADAAWIACASSSLPVPVSPSSSTGESTCAARRPCRFVSRLTALVPTKLANVYFARRACASERCVAISSCWTCI
ncbi:hypothetical protein DO70_4342 [Burkholderia pseudomallei]|nr:hypothetical protein DO70_4342 [Burkholderia pseudomallei]